MDSPKLHPPKLMVYLEGILISKICVPPNKPGYMVVGIHLISLPKIPPHIVYRLHVITNKLH